MGLVLDVHWSTSSSVLLHSEVHPRSFSTLQEALSGSRPAVGWHPPTVAQLQRQRGLRVAQTQQLLLLKRQKGHKPEDVLHQQEPHHARSGEQVQHDTLQCLCVC